MAERRGTSTNPNLSIPLPPPSSTGTQSNAPYTPRSSSFADDSDAEFDPTPLHSPRGGPTYDDLPPSYEFSQQQALDDVRNGVAPLDPNQLEAHRLTINEGPNEAEVWEYRARGEDPDHADEQERAPEYQNVTNHMGTTVPVQHVPGSESIPVGRVSIGSAPSYTAPDHAAVLLSRALEFTRHDPDGDVQYAPRLSRRVAIPQLGRASRQGANGQEETIQFLRAYAKALHAHSIRPAEFADFLDGLNAVCLAARGTGQGCIREDPAAERRLSLVHDYIRGANEAFFAPRGLRVSIRSLHALVEAIQIPTERGQRAGAIASVLDEDSTAERRAYSLHPWIEALDTNVPEPSAQTLVLREMAVRFDGSRESGDAVDSDAVPGYIDDKNARRDELQSQHDDPPHSLPDPSHDHHYDHGRPGRHRGGRGVHRGPWTPFGMPGHGPFGAPGRGPFGAPGNGPFGAPGNGPSGPWGHNRSGSHGRGRGRGRGHAHFGRDGGHRGNEAGGHPPNEWAALGRDLGKMGEQLGKRMEEWGMQFGRQAEAWGADIERRTSNWGDNVSARASGSGTRTAQGPTPAYDAPPSYPEGSNGQESGVLRGDSKSDISSPKPGEKSSDKKKGKQANDDDYSSSTSDSDSSLDSDSDSDSDDEDTDAVFLKRVRSINKQADAAKKKGKKGPREISHERSLAIEAAQHEKTKMDLKNEHKRSRREVQRQHKKKSKELMRDHRNKKRELRVAHTEKGKGKGKATKTPEWKEAKREYREKKRELKNERMASRKDWREVKANIKKLPVGTTSKSIDLGKDSEMVWLVIENLDD